MKKLILMILLAALLLACCAENASSTYTVVTQNGEFTVDTVNQTITDGSHTYQYEVSRTSVTIRYPDGSSYWRSYDSGNSWHGGWSADYDETAYVPGDTLIGLLERDSGSSNKSGNPLLGIFLIAIGLWHAIAPQSAWQFNQGWKFKDAQPSELALAVYRISGVLAVLFGLGAAFLG